MAYPKTRLQDAEEAPGLHMKLVEINGFEHESVGTCLKDLLFIFDCSADGNNRRLIARVGFDAAADFDSVNARDHDIENQQIGFYASDFDQSGNTVRRCRDLVSALALQKCADEIDDPRV